MPFKDRAYAFAADRGWEVRRSIATRRQDLFRALGVELVVDVGAAVGTYGQQLRHFGYRGRILSLEPLDRSFAQLQAVAAKDPTWDVLRSAAGREPGEANIHVAGNWDSSSLLPMLASHSQAAPEADYVGSERITVVRLDDVVPDAITHIKIDVQGLEDAVLDGGPTVLGSTVSAELEVSFVPIYDGGVMYDAIFARMATAGFRPAHVSPGMRDSIGSLMTADVIFVRE